jgi:AraC-like DNA-binding protein
MYDSNWDVYISNMRDGPGHVGLRILTCQCRRIEVWRYADLSAPYWRAYWNAQPGWAITHAGHRVELVPGSFVSIPPNTPFAGHSDAPADHLYAHFVAGFPYDRVVPRVHACNVDSSLRATIRDLASRARRGATDSGRGSVLSHLLCYHALSMVPLEHVPVRPYSQRVVDAMAVLEGGLGRAIPNPELSREVGMSTNGLIRLFTEETGVSPQKWYLQRRVDYACELLHHSRLSIDQIADESGFCDRAHFSKVFRRMRGMGPAEFRKTRPP